MWVRVFSVSASMSSLVLLVCVILPFLFVENLRSTANARQLRRRGAIEPPDDPYVIMGIVYVGGFVAMAAEGWWRGGAAQRWLLSGLLIFTLAKLLKFYAVASLGPFWSFHVLVLPGERLVTRGPYRYLRHPNYVAVMGELIGAAIMLGAPVVGAIVVVAFAAILWKRIAVEERALGLRP